MKDKRYCTVEESLEESLKQMKAMREDKLPKKTWKEFRKELEDNEEYDSIRKCLKDFISANKEKIYNDARRNTEIYKNKWKEGKAVEEQKYFISYAAYYGDDNKHLFNSVIYIDEEITTELIQSIEQSLLERLNENTKSKYYAVQIININRL